MKTRTRIPAKVVAKPPQQPIQTTLERHSISRDLQENSAAKTREFVSASSNSSLSSHNLNAISVLPKRRATTSPPLSDRSAPWLNQDRINPKTIHPQQQHQAVQNINSSPQKIQRGLWDSVKKGVSNVGKAIGGAVSGATDWVTKQFNSGKGEADRILKNAEREANQVIQAGEAEAKRIMGDGSVSSSRAKSSGGIVGKILQKIKSVVSGGSKGKITFSSGGKYNARGRAKAVAEAAKRKARRVAALARLRAKRFLRQRERIAKHLVNSAKTQAERINQDAKSRSQRMMERGEYTAARSLLYKEKKRARLLIHRNKKYAQNILDKAQPVANRIIAKGKLKAERIIERGEKKADFIIQDGKKRADNVIREAKQRAEQIREKGKRDADKAIRQQRKNFFQKLTGWIGDGISGLVNAVGNVIKAAGKFLGKVVQGAANFLKAVGQGIKKLGQAIADGAAKAWNNVKKAVKKAAEAVKEFVKEAVKIVKEIAQIIVDVISAPFKILGQMKAIIDRIGGKVKTIWTKILKNPLKFGETLINGGKAGFKKFANGFLGHLENGIQSFLFGQTKLKFPSFSIQGIIQWLLEAVGLSGKQVRQMAVDKLGEDKVVFAEGLSEAASEGKLEEFAEDQLNTYKDNVLEQASGEVNSYKDKAVGKASKTLGVPSNKLNILVQLLTAVRKGGEGIVNFFKELNLKDMVKEMVFEGIKDYLMETIKERAIPFAMAKLAASTTPIVGWIMAAIDALKMAHTVFIKYANQVEALVDSVGDSLVNAANHVETGVATKLEEGMGRAIPVLMAALASYANINNIPEKIQGIVEKAQDWVNSNIKPPINKIIETVGSFIPDLSGKQLVNSVKQGVSSVVTGAGDIYDQLRKYLTGVTNKTFDSKEQAETEIKKEFESKGLQLPSLDFKPAKEDNTGHIYDVIAMKPLPGRKVVGTNRIRISRKLSVANNINSKRVARFPKPNNIVSRNSISTIQTNSVSRSAKPSSSRIYTRTIKSKPIVPNFVRQKSPLISKAVATRLPNLQKQSQMGRVRTTEKASTQDSKIDNTQNIYDGIKVSKIPIPNAEYKFKLERDLLGKWIGINASIIIERSGNLKRGEKGEFNDLPLEVTSGNAAVLKMSAALTKYEGDIPWLRPMQIEAKALELEKDITQGKKPPELNLATIGLKYGKVVSDDIAQELFPGINTDNYKVKIEGEFALEIPASEVAELLKIAEDKAIRYRANQQITKLNTEGQQLADELKELRKKSNELRRKLNKNNRKGYKKDLIKNIENIDKQINSLKSGIQNKLEKSKILKNRVEDITKLLQKSDFIKQSVKKQAIKSFAGKMALKALGRVAIKAVPFLGWASLIYDAYKLAEFIKETVLPEIEKLAINELEELKLQSEDSRIFVEAIFEGKLESSLIFIEKLFGVAPY
jgi:phage-related protein/superoxide dismutase